MELEREIQALIMAGMMAAVILPEEEPEDDDAAHQEYRGVRMAAYAIVKHLQEGVIWQGQATLSHLEDTEKQPWTEVALWGRDLVDPGSYFGIDGHKGDKGQVVEVIVRRRP